MTYAQARNIARTNPNATFCCSYVSESGAYCREFFQYVGGKVSGRTVIKQEILGHKCVWESVERLPRAFYPATIEEV